VEYRNPQINKYNKKASTNQNEHRDKVECVQKAQAYIQEHIAESQAETQTELKALRDDIKTLLRHFLQR
jgi:hypothetical protein